MHTPQRKRQRSVAMAGALLAMAAGHSAQAADLALLARGKALFGSVKPACATCHTLQAAQASGEIGPVLDDLQPSAERVLRVLRSGLGLMPTFSGVLSEADMAALAYFVSQSTNSAPASALPTPASASSPKR